MITDIVRVERKTTQPTPIGELVHEGVMHEKIGIGENVKEIDMSSWNSLGEEIRKMSLADRREHLATHYIMHPEMVLKTSEVYCNDVVVTDQFRMTRKSTIEFPVENLRMSRDKRRSERQNFYFAGLSHSHGESEGVFSFQDLRTLFLAQRDMDFGLFAHLVTPTMDRLIFRTKDTPRLGKKIAAQVVAELEKFHYDFLGAKMAEFEQLDRKMNLDLADELARGEMIAFAAEQYKLALFEKKSSETVARRVERFSL